MKNLIRKRNFLTIVASLLIVIFIAAPAAAKTISVYWYNPYYSNLASVTLPADDQVDTYFDLKGTVDSKYTAVLVKTVYNSDEAYYYFPVNKNSVEGAVYLRFGKGTYQVEVNLVKPSTAPGTMAFDRLAKTTVENTREGDQRYLLPSWGVENDKQVIIDKALEITKGIKDDYLKVKAIHQWVNKNIKYDMEKFNKKQFYDNEGAVKTLQTKKGLCRDYTGLTNALSRAVGIEARTVIGQALSGGAWSGHAWSEVKVGDRWISIDTTWNVFDPAPATFSNTHRKVQDVY